MAPPPRATRVISIHSKKNPAYLPTFPHSWQCQTASKALLSLADREPWPILKKEQLFSLHYLSVYWSYIIYSISNNRFCCFPCIIAMVHKNSPTV